MSPRPRIAALLLTAICGAASGCFGGSQNPSYFPFYLPTGDVIRTHAKPPGVGYFADFDRKATKIEVMPTNASNPPRTQVVIIATVVDKDGDPRRKRRVEWAIEGPGSIVEVDESGYLPGRGYQVTEKFAVSYTDYFTHTITRGNDDPRDDFEVKPGQSWCVVSSPVPGETIVTAYAPEVHNWDCRRAFARLTWTDSGFAPTRTNRETDSTLRDKAAAPATANEAQLVLDAKLPGAVAVNRDATGTISLSNTGRMTSSEATVRAVVPETAEFVRSEPAPSRRSGRDLFWTLAPTPGGEKQNINIVVRPIKSGPFTLIASAETADGLRAGTKADSAADTAGLRVTVTLPPLAAAGEAVDAIIEVKNTGNVPLENAVAWVSPDPGLATPGGTSPAEVKIGSVPAGTSRSVTAKLIAEKSGKTSVKVDITADGGLSARGEATTTVGRAALDLRIVGPESIPVGESAGYDLIVTNAGDLGTAEGDVKANLPRGLNAKGAGEWSTGPLAPGEKKVIRLTVVADTLMDRSSLTASATGRLPSGVRLPAVRGSAVVSIVGQPLLTLELTAPNVPVPLGGRAVYRAVVTNRGNTPAKLIALTAELSSEMKPIRGSGPKSTAASLGERSVAFGAIAELAAGASAAFTMEAEAVSAGDARIRATVRANDLSGPLHEDQATRVTGRR